MDQQTRTTRARRLLLGGGLVIAVTLLGLRELTPAPPGPAGRNVRGVPPLTAQLDATPAPVLPAPPITGRPRLILHAGGAIDGLRYTNSKNALDRHYAAGGRYFEVDLLRTSDGEPVLVHDWQQYARLLGRPAERPTLEAFERTPLQGGLVTLSLRGLVEWLGAHPEATIVTDVKDDNLAVLGLLAERWPQARARFIPQAYDPKQYLAIRALGFENVILTLYRSKLSDDQVLDFARQHAPWAVTMTVARALGHWLALRLRALPVAVYCHGASSEAELGLALERGAYGGYAHEPWASLGEPDKEQSLREPDKEQSLREPVDD